MLISSSRILAITSLLVLVTTSCLWVSPSVARGDFILDQVVDPSGLTNADHSFDSRVVGGNVDQQGAQTFTVGITGTLGIVDVYLFQSNSFTGTGNFIFEIRPTVGGKPMEENSSVLLSRTLPVAPIPTSSMAVGAFYRVDFSDAGIEVASGEILAISLRKPVDGSLVWGGINNSPYTEGASFFRNRSGFPTWTDSSVDLGFRTFVQPSVVPEPSAVFMLGSGTLILLGYGRRRSRAAGV